MYIALWIMDYFCGGPMCSKSSLKKLVIQRKKVIRIIDNAKYNESTPPLFKKWRILKLEDQIDLQLAKFAYKFSKSDLPKPILGLCVQSADVHGYLTRSRNFPRSEIHKSKTFHESFLKLETDAIHIFFIYNGCKIIITGCQFINQA